MDCPAWRMVVVVPTYNERTNLPLLIGQVMEQTGFSVLVVDDSSPDGTGQIAEDLSRSYAGRVAVLHRSPPRGLGRSYQEGLRRALELGAEVICQMDADLSHDPAYLPQLVAATDEADVIVGSRYVTGVSVANWPLHRLLLSLAGNAYVRMITGLRVRDATSGFKCWRRSALNRVLDSPLRSEGYALQFEMLFHAARARFRIVEIPIIFVERREGASKMSWRVMRESLLRPLQLMLSRPSRAPVDAHPRSSEMRIP